MERAYVGEESRGLEVVVLEEGCCRWEAATFGGEEEDDNDWPPLTTGGQYADDAAVTGPAAAAEDYDNAADIGNWYSFSTCNVGGSAKTTHGGEGGTAPSYVSRGGL